MFRLKNKKEKPELIKELVQKDVQVAILSIVLKGVSKVKKQYIYQCKYLDNGKENTIPIIAIDVTHALAKLEPYVNSKTSPKTLKWLLGNEEVVNGLTSNLTE